MHKKIKATIIFNLIFYFFIFLHRIVMKKYGDDYVIHLLFYLALIFSSILLEDSLRRKIKGLRLASFFDFSLRVLVLVFHFLSLYSLDMIIVNIITGIALLANITIQFTIYFRYKEIPNAETDSVTYKDIKKLRKLRQEEINSYKIGTESRKEINDAISLMILNGKGNLVCIILFLLIFITRFIFMHFTSFVYISLAVVVFFTVLFIRLHNELVNNGFVNEQKNIRKIIIENISFVIGYILIFLGEVIWQENLGYMLVSYRVVSVLFFIPVINRKYHVGIRLKEVYIKYSEWIMYEIES